MFITVVCEHSPLPFKIEMSKSNFYRLHSLMQCKDNTPRKINNKWYQADSIYLIQFKSGKSGANYTFLNSNVIAELKHIIDINN